MVAANTLLPVQVDATPNRLPRGILIADGEEMIRELLGMFLAKQGVPYWLAGSSAEAVDLYRAHAARIAFVLLDVHLPGPHGPAAFRKLKELDPALACYFMSADWAPYSEEELLDMGAVGVASKPFLFKLLSAVASQCLAA